MGLTNDDFIRTTEPRHQRGVQALWRKIRDNGSIYQGTYTGQYCVSDELFVDVPARRALPRLRPPDRNRHRRKLLLQALGLPGAAHRPHTEQPTTSSPRRAATKCSASSAAAARPLHLAHDLRLGHPCSRTTEARGLRLARRAGQLHHRRRLRLDSDTTKFDRYWPADLHLIGKEIMRFHCVYWPAFLMAAGLPLPKGITAHGWLLFEESKMSKSRGNIVRTETIVDTLGPDALRYFLLREVVFGQDGSFSFDALVQRYNSDLANGLGNLASRTLTMITRYFKGEIPYPSHTAHTAADDVIADAARKAIADYGTFFEQYQFSRALETAWALVAAVDRYIVENAPWALDEKKDEESRARLATVLYTSAEALRIVTALAHPVVPDATAKIWAQLGLGDIGKFDLTQLQWGQLQLGTKLGEVQAVFPRADKSAIERMQKMEEQSGATGVSPSRAKRGSWCKPRPRSQKPIPPSLPPRSPTAK